jgi:hypothetical protein
MDKRFLEMTVPEQLSAYESALAEVSRLKAQLGEYSRKMIDAADEIIAWKDASGLECGCDPDGITPAKANKFWDAEAKKPEHIITQPEKLTPEVALGESNQEIRRVMLERYGWERLLVEAFQVQPIEHQADVVAFRHDIEMAEHERDQARKELEDWKRLHSQPIHNPPEATGEYVDVMGEMTIPFTVQLPVELCHEPIACDDPAVEAALQAVSGHIFTYIWGEDRKPAVVYCDVGDQNVEIESDDRKCLEKDSTRLTDEPVNSGSCNDGDLAPKRERSLMVKNANKIRSETADVIDKGAQGEETDWSWPLDRIKKG